MGASGIGRRPEPGSSPKIGGPGGKTSGGEGSIGGVRLPIGGVGDSGAVEAIGVAGNSSAEESISVAGGSM